MSIDGASNHNKIVRAAGNMYLADVLAVALEQLRPNLKKHQTMVERMKKELIEIRNAECVAADNAAALKN